MRKYILSFALLFVLAALYAGAARAQVGEQLRETRQEFKQFRQAEVQEFKQRLEQLKAANQTKREEFKATVEQNRSELRTRVQTEREQLKEKLAAIKDERKKQIVERVAQQLNELNERQPNSSTNSTNGRRIIWSRFLINWIRRLEESAQEPTRPRRTAVTYLRSERQ